MPIEVFLMILAAALLHATWNAVVKSDGDRLALIKVLATTQLVLSLCLAPFVAVPAPESWPYLAASPFLGLAYMLLLNRAYHVGDLSLVYPLARGVAPLIVAVISVSVLGEHLNRASQIAILFIGLGITSLALTRGTAGLRDPRPALLALGTGGLIAGYTILDGLGARAAGSAHGFMAWVQIITTLLIIASVHWLQQGRRVPISRRSLHAGIITGLISYVSSWLVLWAYTLAPLAMVSALRETGIVFAVIIGVVFLKERLNLTRLASIAATLIGTTLLKFSR
jgi:drug/metabolite transporter (DMT)-like permease